MVKAIASAMALFFVSTVCGYGEDAAPVPADSIVDVPLFIEEGRPQPCYPCAPRTMLRRYAKPGSAGTLRSEERADLFTREAALATLIFEFVSYERGYARSDDRDELECRAQRDGKREIVVRAEVRLSETGRAEEVEHPPYAECGAWAAGGWSATGERKGWSGRTLTKFESLVDRLALREWTYPDYLANSAASFLFIEENVSNAVWRVEIESSSP